MKTLVCCTIVLVMCAFAQVQGNCPYKEETLSVGKHTRDCLTITCNNDGSIFAVPCPVMQCKNQIGYHELDLSKPYPECCARPICAEN